MLGAISYQNWRNASHIHRSAQKQGERQSQITALSDLYQQPLSFSEQQTHALSLPQLVSQCRSGILSPLVIMQTYGKRCLRAHKATNCLTDFMFDEALQTPALATWAPNVGAGSAITGDRTRNRSLMGVPVSIKGERAIINAMRT